MNHRTRIAHLTFDMRIGGAEQVIHTLVTNADHAKYDISVLCLEKEIQAFGLDLHQKGFRVVHFNRRPGFDFRLILDIRRYLVANDVRILHCHQYTPFVYGVLAALTTPARVVFTEHGRFYPDKRKIKRCLVNPLLSLATDDITAISYATRQALKIYENFPVGRIRVVYNGIDARRLEATPGDREATRHALGISETELVLGTVARLDCIKNHPMMLRALKLVVKRFPETRLLIVGDGPERCSLENLCQVLGIADRVIFTGFRTDTYLMYAAMDIFLLTSYSEGTAMTLLEAMAAGLPCIATRVGGNPEIVADGETGFVVEIDDYAGLAEKIQFLLKNQILRQKMGKRGKTRFDENFLVKKMLDGYENLYE